MADFNGQDQTITVRQGETLTFIFTHTRSSDASKIDITNEKFRITVKKNAKSMPILALSSAAPLVDAEGTNPYDPSMPPTQSSIGVVDGPNGRWELRLSAVKTSEFPAGDYQYEIDKIQPDGSVRTILAGPFVIGAELS